MTQFRDDGEIRTQMWREIRPLRRLVILLIFAIAVSISQVRRVPWWVTAVGAAANLAVILYLLVFVQRIRKRLTSNANH
jgi:predicted permease